MLSRCVELVVVFAGKDIFPGTLHASTFCQKLQLKRVLEKGGEPQVKKITLALALI